MAFLLAFLRLMFGGPSEIKTVTEIQKFRNWTLSFSLLPRTGELLPGGCPPWRCAKALRHTFCSVDYPSKRLLQKQKIGSTFLWRPSLASHRNFFYDIWFSSVSLRSPFEDVVDSDEIQNSPIHGTKQDNTHPSCYLGVRPESPVLFLTHLGTLGTPCKTGICEIRES